MPKISICIPTYESAHLIMTGINSVLNQSFKDFEIIICDNNSNDNTDAVIQDIDDQRIRYYKNETNIGYPSNVNRCLSLATGELITILCADDFFIYDDIFDYWVKTFIDNPVFDIIHSPFQSYNFTGDEFIPKGLPFSPLHEKINTPKEVLEQFLLGNGPFGWGWCFRRTIIQSEEIKFELDHTMAPDTLFWLDLSMRHNVYETPINKPFYAFCSHSDNMGFQFFENHKQKIYDQLIFFEDRLFSRIQYIMPQESRNFLSYKYRYTINEYIGWIRRAFLDSKISRLESLKIIFAIINKHFNIFCNKRNILNVIMILLPIKFTLLIQKVREKQHVK